MAVGLESLSPKLNICNRKVDFLNEFKNDELIEKQKLWHIEINEKKN